VVECRKKHNCDNINCKLVKENKALYDKIKAFETKVVMARNKIKNSIQELVNDNNYLTGDLYEWIIEKEYQKRQSSLEDKKTFLRGDSLFSVLFQTSIENIEAESYLMVILTTLIKIIINKLANNSDFNETLIYEIVTSFLNHILSTADKFPKRLCIIMYILIDKANKNNVDNKFVNCGIRGLIDFKYICLGIINLENNLICMKDNFTEFNNLLLPISKLLSSIAHGNVFKDNFVDLIDSWIKELCILGSQYLTNINLECRTSEIDNSTGLPKSFMEISFYWKIHNILKSMFFMVDTLKLILFG